MGKGDLFGRIKMLCPDCQGMLKQADPGNSIVCSLCYTVYPSEGRLIDLIPGKQTAHNFPQLAMESAPLISLYDSCLWRRSPLFAFFMGITFEKEYEITLKDLDLRKDDVVLDLACGTGIYGRRIAPSLPDGMLVGLDISLPMLSYARKGFDDKDLSNYLLIHGDAANIPLPDESVDAAMCGGALHLFPDIESAVLEVHRVLKEGGRFAVSVFSRGEGMFFEWISSMVQMMEGIRGITPSELEGVFSRAKFESIVCHHAKALWLIMSAVKE